MDSYIVFGFALIFVLHIDVPVSSISSGSATCRPGSYHVTTNGPCEECPDGWYGDQCQEQCNCFRLFSKEELCNKTDGSCACLSGWAGKDCTELCPVWSYGENCKKICDCKKENTKYCHHVTGKCVCEPAWEGKTCAESAVHSETQSAVQKTLHTCKALPIDINCGDFQVYLKETRYGQWPSAACKPLSGEACLADSITSFASKQCAGKNKCIISATNDNLGGNPCPHDSNNTLEVSYVCGYPKTVAVCENKSLALRCTSGTIVVQSARYGRWEDALCTKGEDCLTKEITAVVYSMCVRKAECTLMASNDMFGDPCIGVLKTLEVTFYCDSGQTWECHPENTAKSIQPWAICICKAGYHGIKCDQLCPLWTWGEMCSRSCKCKSSVATSCNNVNGACTCKPGWIGESCEKACPLPSYGVNCSSTCFCDLNNTKSCNYPNGTCQCKDGYTGTNCTHRCANSTYGNACNFTCNCTSANTQHCNHVNGTCVCRDGYTGTTCSEECTNSTYGKFCNSICNCTATNTQYCSHVNGTCVCREGYTGTTCSEVTLVPATAATQTEKSDVVAIVLSVLAAVVFLICVVLLILWKCYGFNWKKWKELILRRNDKKLLSGASIPPLDVKEPHRLDDVHSTPVLTRRTSTFKDEFAKATRMKFPEEDESSSAEAYYYATGINLSGDLNEGKPKESIQTSDYYSSAFANLEDGIKFSLGENGPNGDEESPKSKSKLSPLDYSLSERRASKTASIGKRSRSPSPAGRRTPKVPMIKIPLPPTAVNADQKPQTELNSTMKSQNAPEAIYNNTDAVLSAKSVDLPGNKDDKKIQSLPEATYYNTDMLEDDNIVNVPQEEVLKNIETVQDAKIDQNDKKIKKASQNVEEVTYDVIGDVTQDLSENSKISQNEDAIYDNVV